MLAPLGHCPSPKNIENLPFDFLIPKRTFKHSHQPLAQVQLSRLSPSLKDCPGQKWVTHASHPPLGGKGFVRKKTGNCADG